VSIELTESARSAENNEIVTVEIGPNGRKYYLHKALLVYHSEFFEKALQGTWLEAEEDIVRLTDFETYECEYSAFCSVLCD